MSYTPKWLSIESWQEVGKVDLSPAAIESAGVPTDAALALKEFGLPREIEGMFYPCENHHPLEPLNLPDGRQAFVLGQNETGVPGLYCVDVAGTVVHCLEGDVRIVNTSLPAFLDALAAWKAFLEAFPEEDEGEDEDYEKSRTSYGKKLAKSVKKADSEAYRQRGSWWSRVYEDVKRGIL
ncbi:MULTISPECIES: SUKH-4 family immunity protein [unclassified Spirillospora]|uniref:SUKH-4 family immunity protein n=1 Tax=unclassified Spirillospora TaxID=2642701 RepID=UPI00371C4173